jgi:tetratricopeptide (TPR) repeat protein
VARLVDWLSGRGRPDGHSSVILQFAREVVERRRSMQGALNEVRHPAVLDSLSDEDFRALDETIAENAELHQEFAIVLARLAHAAARAKGFDRQIVDAAIRLDSLLPLEDPSRERDQLLRDAYVVAQKAGYARGGRITLARLADRALDNDDIERARKFFTQQLEIGDESTDSRVEVDSAISCGDILRREGDILGAQAMYRRASRSAQRLDYHHGLAEALVRQIDLVDASTSLETVAQMQRQALDAAERTSDLGLQSRILLMHAETLTRLGRTEEVAPVLADGVEIARDIGDLSLESRCLQALVDIEDELGREDAVAEHLADWLELEERLGNRTAAGTIASRLGMTLLRINEPDDTVEAFNRARSMAATLRDPVLEQRAFGGLGVAYAQLNEPANAIDNLMRALEVARQTADIESEARWLATIAQTLMQYGQTSEAIRAVNDGLAITRRMPDESLQADLLAMLGGLYLRQDQSPRARESFTRALEIYRRTGPPSEQMRVLVSLGQLAAIARQSALAISQYEQALTIATEIGDRLAQARLHGRLGQILHQQRDTIGALEHYRRAVDAAEAIDNRALMERGLMALATAQHAIGDTAAMSTYRRVLTMVQESGLPDREAMIHYNMGLLDIADGDTSTGLKHLYRASDILADADLLDTEMADAIEDAITAAGGRTLARVGQGSRRYDEAEDYDERDERWAPGETWGQYGDQAEYPPDELYSESTLPPG